MECKDFCGRISCAGGISDNRDIMECKDRCPASSDLSAVGDNRDIMECKEYNWSGKFQSRQ